MILMTKHTGFDTDPLRDGLIRDGLNTELAGGRNATVHRRMAFRSLGEIAGCQFGPRIMAELIQLLPERGDRIELFNRLVKAIGEHRDLEREQVRRPVADCKFREASYRLACEVEKAVDVALPYAKAGI